ncbi:hypothetical protein [Thiobacillus sp.]
MNELRYGQSSSTFSYVLMAGLVAAQLMQSDPAHSEHTSLSSGSLRGIYSATGNTNTFSTYGNPISGAYEVGAPDFEFAVGRFYARLLEEQEPLGAEFEKVLYDNLWDLYES